jgi:hypothetical protein
MANATLSGGVLPLKRKIVSKRFSSERGRPTVPPRSQSHLTRHASTRMAQRGIAESDVELISNLGTEVEGGYLFREKDFDAADRELKRQRQRLRRLVGKRVAIQGGVVIVTAYHVGRRTERRLLRSA